jgi:hypothetical protein
MGLITDQGVVGSFEHRQLMPFNIDFDQCDTG